MQERQTACKIWISNLLNGEYVKSTGEFEPHHIISNGFKVARANIIANVIDTFKSEDNNYSSITIDDGSSTIRVKAFKDDISILQNISVGDIVLIIGKPRQYLNEIYLIPEIVKRLDDPNWELLRKIELLKLYGKPEKIKERYQEIRENSVVEETINKSETTENLYSYENQNSQELITSTSRQKIINLIEKSDETGAVIQDLIENSGIDKEESELIVKDLVKEGIIYENKPGHVKLLD